MLPDQGVYEERYRLTGSVAASLAVSLVMLGIGLHGSGSALWVALSVLAFVTVTVPALATAAGRRIAFRADPMGVTLGVNPQAWPGRDNSPVFISWADVEKIVIYPASTAGRLCVGVQRREGAPPLSRGNEPARRCPVPGVAEGATRTTVAWRLDRERLTTITAALAPAVQVIDASSAEPAVEAPGAGATGEADGAGGAASW